jgi:ABC-2 type transport system ATP-binding protein
MAIVEFENVTKRFGAVSALDQASFTIPEGGIFGFLGANGAGKTTSLRLILDILQADSGGIGVFGRAPSRAAAVEIGYLPEERGLYGRMKVEDNLIFFARLRGLGGNEARRSAQDILERMGIGEYARMAVIALSKGNAQKVQLAATFIARPRLLLLDEPFSGLDPLAQQALEEMLRATVRDGATVVFSTHVMSQAERLCQSLLLLSRGRPLFQGSLAEALAAVPTAPGKSASLHEAFLHFVGPSMEAVA